MHTTPWREQNKRFIDPPGGLSLQARLLMHYDVLPVHAAAHTGSGASDSRLTTGGQDIRNTLTLVREPRQGLAIPFSRLSGWATTAMARSQSSGICSIALAFTSESMTTINTAFSPHRPAPYFAIALGQVETGRDRVRRGCWDQTAWSTDPAR